MEAKLADTEKNRENLAAQLQKISFEQQAMAANELRYMNEVGEIQQQLEFEANKGKALLDQVQKVCWNSPCLNYTQLNTIVQNTNPG